MAMAKLQRIKPFLWYDGQAVEAAEFYTSIFKNSRIMTPTKYGKAGTEIHGQKAGKVMTVSFEIDGMEFVALNGGPMFKFTEAISFQVICETQDEIDYYWEKLGAGGDPKAQQCAWLKDKFGVSWQVVPAELGDLLGGGDQAARERVMHAMLQMKKLDIAKLRQAQKG
jgi:predicted 3-demethylubiquinone-9 3-methyltransferase (glyoxalase superfamily)